MPDAYNPWGAPVFPTAADNAMQPETFVPQGVRDWTQQAAPKDYNILSQIAGSLGKALMYPGQVAQSQTPISTEDMVGPAFNLAGMLIGGGMPMAENGALGMAGGKLTPNLFDTVAAKYPELKIDGSMARSPNDYATLSRIAVPEEMRGQGLATKAMQDIVAEADKSGTNLALSPSNDWGASVARLKDFYSRFGFVPNAGKSKDFATRETMIRPPRKSD